MAEPAFSERGFARFKTVTCEYGSEVKVYESSAASGPRVWLSIDDSAWRSAAQKQKDCPGHSSAHLTLDQARKIRGELDAAITFMETRDRDWLGEDDEDA